MPFRDRIAAGVLLARRLGAYRIENPLVLGLTRGGAPVAFSLAETLGAEFDLWGVSKVRLAELPDLPLGAVAEGPGFFLDPDVVERRGISRTEAMRAASLALGELERHLAALRQGESPRSPAGRTVVLVDDGALTGVTLLAALEGVRRLEPERIIAAVPVISDAATHRIRSSGQALVALTIEERIGTLAAAYDSYEPVSDWDLARLRDAAALRTGLDEQEGAP